MAGSAEPPERAAELSDLTVAELHAYIHRLRAYIQGLQDYNASLERELSEVQRREFQSMTHHG